MTQKEYYIIIAEDDEDDAELVMDSFEKCGAFVHIKLVANGVELMQILEAERHSPPDIILTDLNMPKKDGYEALLEISTDPDFNKIPVFVYSTTINPAHVLKCKTLGAVDFLIKPFRLEEIDEMPMKLLKFLNKNVKI